MRELYVLKLPEADSGDPYTRYQAVAPVEAPPEACTACGAPVALPDWLAPYQVRLSASGALLADVAFGPRTDLLVTREFLAFWNRAGLFGLSGFEPVEVLDVSAQTTFTGEDREYLHCAVARTEAMLDEKESEAERTGGMPCAQCGSGGVLKHLRQVVLKNPPAAGLDLFVVKGLTTAVLASKRFAGALAGARVTGCQLVAADQIRAL